jgi:hypothetical protein
VKKRISGQMLPSLRRNDGHGKPHHEKIKLFKSGGIFASMFTKGQFSRHGDHWTWRLVGNCWGQGNLLNVSLKLTSDMVLSI